MKTLITSLAVIAVIIGGAYVWLTRGDMTWRQKLVVTVSTPNGDVSGEAVTEVSMHINRVFKDGARYQFSLKGEAAVVDLGNRKYLFVLLSKHRDSDALSQLLSQVVTLPIDTKVPAWENQFIEKIENIKSPIAIPNDLLPTFVTFADPNNPRSVKVMKPNELHKVFGEGFSLKSVNLSITNEPETLGKVLKVLSWLRDLRGGLVPTKMKPASDYMPEEELGPHDFYRERKYQWNYGDSAFRNYGDSAFNPHAFTFIP